MILQDFTPGLAISAYVKCYRIVRFSFDSGAVIPSKAYPPKPEQVIHFFTRDPLNIQTGFEPKQQAAPILFTAQQTHLVKRMPGHNFIDIQIVFQPSAVFQLTGIPAYELADHFFDATEIFSASILQVTFNQLQDAPDNTDVIERLDSCVKWLVAKAKPRVMVFDKACKLLTAHQGNTSIAWLANQSCYSTKQFNRKFNESVGVNPKTYSRILRFNRAFNTRNRFPAKAWANIAAECGYTDYQHLAKDYTDFTGYTPLAFHLAENKSPESVLGLTKALYHNRY